MSKKPMKLLLWISLAANLFVVGAIGSFFGLERYKDLRLVTLGSSQKLGLPGRSSDLRSLLLAMDREDQREIRRLFQEARSKVVGLEKGARQVMTTELAQAIRATPFDADTVLALIEVDYSRLSSRLDLVRTTLVKKIASMPLESREKLAENLLSGRK